MFVPEPYKVLAFFEELKNLRALPKDAKFIVITDRGKTRAFARNGHTVDVYYGPDLKIRRSSDSQRAIASMDGKGINELWAEAEGPATVSPFDLHKANLPDVPWNGSYSFTVRCKLRLDSPPRTFGLKSVSPTGGCR